MLVIWGWNWSVSRRRLDRTITRARVSDISETDNKVFWKDCRKKEVVGHCSTCNRPATVLLGMLCWNSFLMSERLTKKARKCWNAWQMLDRVAKQDLDNSADWETLSHSSRVSENTPEWFHPSHLPAESWECYSYLTLSHHHAAPQCTRWCVL